MSFRKGTAVVGLAAAIAGAGYRLYKELDSIQNPPYHPAVQTGQRPPEIVGTAIDGGQLKLSDLEGKVVLLDFFSTNCGPCRRLTPELVKLHDSCRDKGLEVVMIGTMNQNQEALRAYAAEHNLPFHVMHDNDESIRHAYGVTGLPGLILIENGRVSGGVTGYGPMCQKWLDSLKNKLKE